MDGIHQLAQALEKKAQIRYPSPITTITPIPGIHAPIPQHKNITNCYYILTELPTSQYTVTSTALTKGYCPDFNSALANQISVVSLSKAMFEGTKPMVGSELKSLYRAMEKQRNSTESLL